MLHSSSAEPQQLYTFDTRTGYLASDLNGLASDLGREMAYFASRCTEGAFRVDVGGIESRLRSHAGENDALGHWVGRVGRQFEEADSIPLFGGMPEMYATDMTVEIDDGGTKLEETSDWLTGWLFKLFDGLGITTASGETWSQEDEPPDAATQSDPAHMEKETWLEKQWFEIAKWEVNIGDRAEGLYSAGVSFVASTSDLYDWMRPQIESLVAFVRQASIEKTTFSPAAVTPSPEPQRPAKSFGDLIEEEQDATENQDQAAQPGTKGTVIAVPKPPPPEPPTMSFEIKSKMIPPPLKQPGDKFWCAPTSSAMIMAYYAELGKAEQAPSIEGMVNQCGTDLKWNGIQAGHMAEHADALDDWRATWQDHVSKESLNRLVAEGPVMAQVRTNLSTTAGAHMVVVWGFSEDGNTVYYNDPLFGDARECSWADFGASFYSNKFGNKTYKDSIGTVVVIRPEIKQD